MEQDVQAGHGPLAGIKIVEFASIGPGPFAAMLLADLGADIVRIDRPGTVADPKEITNRGRRSICLNLKQPDDVQVALRLTAKADALIEGYRPGVMERLGLGPAVVGAANPKLIYGRMTGWGQDGPLAHAAGHDINYIALTGALDSIGPRGGRPTPPLNLLGDLGGGALYLVMGLLAGIIEARSSGRGQVVDCAVVDGATSLMATFYWLSQVGRWPGGRGENFLDGGAHYYATYECADGKYISLGAIEPKFYADLRRRLGLDDPAYDAQNDPEAWPRLSEDLALLFRTRPRAAWCSLLEGSDACFAPVMAMDEARAHPHIQARETLSVIDGVLQPAPAPRFDRTPGAIRRPPPSPDQHRDEILRDWDAMAPASPRTP
jgi:alpha-methylacyl-CoA racemase